MVLGLALSVVLTYLGTAAERHPAEPHRPCYAFLRSGDVFLTCNGRTEQITSLNHLADFAVAPKGESLALENDFVALGNDDVQMIDLKTGSTSLLRSKGRTHLQTSCGTVISIARIATQRRPPREGDVLSGLRSRRVEIEDLLSGQPLRFEPYRDFRCSSDRRTVVGTRDLDGLVLEVGLPPGRSLVSTKRRLLYDVSSNGKYIAFTVEHAFELHVPSKVCVAEGEQVNCTAKGDGPDRISISDSGEVLFVNGINQACNYKDMWHGSVKPLPGYTEGDQCVATFSWRPGQEVPTMLDFLGRQPQWITPEAASLLRAWHSQHSGSRKTRHPHL